MDFISAQCDERSWQSSKTCRISSQPSNEKPAAFVSHVGGSSANIYFSVKKKSQACSKQMQGPLLSGVSQGQSKPGLGVSVFLSVWILLSLPLEGGEGWQTRSSSCAGAGDYTRHCRSAVACGEHGRGRLAVGGDRDVGLALLLLLIYSDHHSQLWI